MSNSIFHVRPLAPMDKIQAQRAVFQLRRKAVNSAKPTTPVNKHADLLPGERIDFSKVRR